MGMAASRPDPIGRRLPSLRGEHHKLPRYYEVPEGTWWACQQPERPGDELVCYWEPCPWCMAKVRIDMERDPEIAEAVAEHIQTHGASCLLSA